jgi:hypothetical protein
VGDFLTYTGTLSGYFFIIASISIYTSIMGYFFTIAYCGCQSKPGKHVATVPKPIIYIII